MLIHYLGKAKNLKMLLSRLLTLTDWLTFWSLSDDVSNLQLNIVQLNVLASWWFFHCDYLCTIFILSRLTSYVFTGVWTGGAGSAAAPPTFAVLEQCSPISLAMWQTDGDDYLLVDFYNFTGVVVVSLLLTCSRRFMIQIYLSTRFRHKMLTLFRGWPVMVNVTHTRRRRSICVICGFTLFLWKSELIRNCE